MHMRAAQFQNNLYEIIEYVYPGPVMICAPGGRAARRAIRSFSLGCYSNLVFL